MPTKIQGKKLSTQQKQSKQQSRGASSRKTTAQKRGYIDHPDDLALIEEILDAAIDEAQGNIEDLESFFEFAEEYTEEFECSDGEVYPLKFNYYEKDGEITGFNVAFASAPKVTTSGTKIMENQGYEKDEPERSKFTISSLIEKLELEDFSEKESRTRKATTKSTASPRAFSKIAAKGKNEFVDDEEDDLDEAPHATSKKTRNRAASIATVKYQIDSEPEEDDLDNLLSIKEEENTDEETPLTKGVLGKIAKSRKQQDNSQDLLDDTKERAVDEEESAPIPPPATATKAQLTKQQLPKEARGSRNNNGQISLAEQVSRVAASAATQGSSVDGINVVGGVGQFTTLATVVGIKTAETIWNALEKARETGREKRVQEIKNNIQHLCDRTDDLTNAVDSIQKANALNQTGELDSLAIEKSNQDKIEKPTSSNVYNDAPLAQSTATIGGKIDELGSKLDPEYKSKPLELDKEKSIDERLDQIQKYLDKLSARLDRLEAVVKELERKLDSQNPVEVKLEPLKVEKTPLAEGVGRNKPIAQSPEMMKKELDASDDIDEFVVNRKNEQQRPIVAEALVKYAMATGEDASAGLPIADGTLYVTREGSKVTVSLEASNGMEIFHGAKTNQEWTIPAETDMLNPSEKDQILKLPQSESEYDRLSTAQDLVEKFRQTFPKRFSGEKDPAFSWREEGIVKYEFEILDLPNGSKELVGTDPRQGDKQVFDAVLTEGERAEIRKCSIPIEEMEKAVYEEKNHARSLANSGSKEQKDDQIEM